MANFGDTGWGAVGLSLTGELAIGVGNVCLSGLTVKYFSPTTNVCIIRVGRDQHNIAWGALTMLTSIEGVRYIPNAVHVSGGFLQFVVPSNSGRTLGTIKHAQLAAISHNRQAIARYRALSKNPGTSLQET